MKKLKVLFAAIILASSLGAIQTKAQATVNRGSEHKPLVFEIDGEQYKGIAYVEFQRENTPSLNQNWVAHGYLISASKWDGNDWVVLDDIPMPKRTINAVDPRGFDEKVKINPKGKVLVSAHNKNIPPW